MLRLAARDRCLGFKPWGQLPTQLPWNPESLGMFGLLCVGLVQQTAWGSRAKLLHGCCYMWLGHPSCTVCSAWRASSLLLGCPGAGPEQCCVSGLPFLLQSLRDHSPEPSGALYLYSPLLCPGWLSEVTGKESRARAPAVSGVSDTRLELHGPCQGCAPLPDAGSGVTNLGTDYTSGNTQKSPY